MAVDIAQLLAFAVKNKASDLHLSSGVPPMIRVDGDMKRINMPPLTHKEVHSMVYDIMNDKQRKAYEEFYETDFSFEIPKLARFRVNAFNQNRGASAVFRNIPSVVLSLDDLNAPKIFKTFRCSRAAWCSSPDRRARQVDDARRDGQLRQRQPPGPHHHDRGPDRVRARVEALPDQPARGASRHARSAKHCVPRCARTRT